MQYPKLSIIIVTYNAAATLQNHLASIYAQACKHIGIVVIDGGSTDGTAELLKENAAHLEFWMSEPDEGIYDAMNKGVKYAKGDWIYFLGADDELLPEFSDMVQELNDPGAIYYANVFAEGSKRLGELTKYQIAKCGPYHQAIIYPRSVFEKYCYNTDYKISADFALTLQLCGDPAYHFEYRDYTIANFDHQGVSGSQIDRRFQKDKGKLVYKYFGLVTWLRYRFHKLKHPGNPRV